MKQRPNTPGTPSRQSGVSLIEVLVSVFVLAFGILGIAGMQAGALRNNQGALENSMAVFLTHSILDAMRASMAHDATNPARMNVRDGYSKASFICQNSEVTATDPLVADDLKLWLKSIQTSLNGGQASTDACGKVVCDATDANLCTATVRWNNSRSLGGAAQQEVSTRSRL